VPDASPLTSSERRAYKLGRRSFERGDDETALAQLRNLLRTRQSFADVHYMLGVLLARRNEPAAATRCLTRALRINPRYAEARLALASLYEHQGDYERSREINEHTRARSAALEGALEGALDPTTRGKLANLQAALGDAYREVREPQEAIEAYRKALDRCPNFHDIRLRLGIALREAGLPNRALAEFHRIQRSRPEWHDATVQAGLTLYTLGRAEDARREWKAVLQQDPERRDARMYLRLVLPR
jgi:tetratricopeptide (TPR) repeat protein